MLGPVRLPRGAGAKELPDRHPPPPPPRSSSIHSLASPWGAQATELTNRRPPASPLCSDKANPPPLQAPKPTIWHRQGRGGAPGRLRPSAVAGDRHRRFADSKLARGRCTPKGAHEEGSGVARKPTSPDAHRHLL